MSSEFEGQPVENAKVIRFGRHEFDMSSNLLLNGKSVVPIAPKSGELLSVLLEFRGKLLSKDELMERVWSDSFVEESNLTHHIAALRRVLGSDGDWIETVPRRGYRFRESGKKELVEVVFRDEEKVTVVEYSDEPLTISRLRSKTALFIFASIAIAAVIASAAWFATERSPSPLSYGSSTVVTTLSGSINSIDVSRDGRFIAYSWSPDKKPPKIYVQMVGSAEPLQLTDAENDYAPAWSPDGKQVAFLRRKGGVAGIYLVPALGGSERKLADLNSPSPVGLTWAPDGRSLALSDVGSTETDIRAIVLFDLSTGERRTVSRPPADSYGDFKPSFSNDSKKLAFSRENNATSQIIVSDVDSGTETLVAVESTFAQSLVWSKGDDAILYSAKRGAVAELFSCPVSGEQKPEKVAALGTQVSRIDSADSGRTLIILNSIRDMNIWQTTIGDNGRSDTDAKLISSPRLEEYPAFSNLGDRIAFSSDRSGTDEIWITDREGRDAFQLSQFNGPVVVSGTWSPDDTKIGAHVSMGQDQDIYWLSTSTGYSTRLTFGGKNFIRDWSIDGKWLYFATVDNNVSKLQKVNVATGEILTVADNGANLGAESLDGRFVYFVKLNEGGIWRVPSGGGPAELVGDGSQFAGLAKATVITGRTGLFLSDNAGDPRMVTDFLDLSTGRLTKLTGRTRPTGLSFDISPDGKQWLSSRTDYLASEIVQMSAK
ncbi:MAG: PD40 domain-containing protein [Blastocatellia bacterium]|nr:PD40 domain-containing protein [Blastocatellia bacterium]